MGRKGERKEMGIFCGTQEKMACERHSVRTVAN